MPCKPARCFEDGWTVRAPYFHIRTVFLRFCASRRPVDRLAGAMLAPIDQMAHNQVLPGKYNTKMPSLYGPARLIIRTFPSPFMASARARTVPAYVIVFFFFFFLILICRWTPSNKDRIASGLVSALSNTF